MIVSDNPEKLDSDHKIKLYQVGDDRELHPGLTTSLFSDMVDSSYEQKFVWENALRLKLIAGELSPVDFFRELQGVEPKDLASRVRIKPSRVARHLTPVGFGSATVEELGRYAVVFGVRIADFFTIIHLAEGLAAAAKADDRVDLQLIDIQKI